jgi:hypothetical protein
MIDLILMAVFFSVGGMLVLLGFLIWTFRDAIGYVVEILGYILESAVKVAVQGGVALVLVADDLLEDWDIGVEYDATDPLLRAVVLGVVGLLLGVLLILLLSVVLGQPWVLITLVVTVALCMAIGLLADPQKDWSLSAFPSFPRRDGGGGPGLPLNL